MIALMKRIGANRKRRHRLLMAHDRLLQALGKTLVGVMRRQEDICDIQAKVMKLSSTALGSAATTVSAMESSELSRDELLAVVRLQLTGWRAAEKALLDCAAVMESESDGRLCHIDQLMKDLQGLK